LLSMARPVSRIALKYSMSLWKNHH